MLALVAVVSLALLFDFVNGLHDSANSIATIVSTRVLSPLAAVVWAAFFNFVAFLIFEATVASNIAHGVSASVVSLTVVACGLVGALIWDVFTWRLALPSSSSHALLGGFAGAAVAKAGFGSLDLHFLGTTAAFIVLSPLLGLFLGAVVMRSLIAGFGKRSPRFVDRTFRRGQLVSAALYSLGHGGNDAQKTMGIITAALVATGHVASGHVVGGHQGPHVPLWVVLACHAAMALGTMTGGWRIVRTLGMGVAKLQPIGGFAAETSGAITLFLATRLGIPVSTTHTIAGAIMGVGSVTKLSAVRWGVAGRMVMAWLFTIPCAAAVASMMFLIATALGLPR
ncbi:MAG TPA: inorganic phosphate transporter [Polyangiaceae bacterium]|jgi:PiT family inorganic phosphate transporter|nr:inorganic phosphate transporter [Polyangiaceae bacterium]